MEKDQAVIGGLERAPESGISERGLSLGREGYVMGTAFATVDATVRHMLDSHGRTQPGFNRERTESRIHEDLAAIRAGLEGPSPTALERVLVERVVVCHAALSVLECLADTHPAGASERGWRQTERLVRRLNEAARTLATVQRMRLPSTPVFVGGQHVHLGGG